MKRSLKELLPQHNRRTITRILVWSGVVLCSGIWGNLFCQLAKIGKADTVFKTYFAMEDSLEHLIKLTDETIAVREFDAAGEGVLKGWKKAAVWLEKMSVFGDSSQMKITYRIDSLQSIPGGNPRIRAFPVHFRITPENRFDRVLDFMKEVTGDSTVAVRIDNLECIGSTIGLFDVLISVTGWIQL